MYSTNNEKKSVVAERFIRTLKNKIYKYMTAISKNVFIDKLDDIVKKYNNTYHTTIKMKPVDVKDNTYIDVKKEINDKDPKFKVGDRVRISKYKNIFAKGYMPNWSEEIFIFKKIQKTVPWTYVIDDLNGQEIIGTFYENELQGTKQNEFRIEKVIKRKGDKLYVKGKGYVILLIAGLIKKTLYKKSQNFKKSYEPFAGDINVKVDLSNYATKDDIKNITHVDTSSFALKTKVDKLDVDKLKPVPTDLSKLSDVVKNDVTKKTDHNKLVTQVDNIDTSGRVKKTDYNTKITEIEDKIPDTSNLATKTALTTVENEIPDVSNLVKQTDYNTKVTDIENKLNNHDHDKYINTSEFNKSAADVFNARIAQANLITKIDFDAKLSRLNRKIANNKSKHLLVENELNKSKTFDSSYFHGKNYFDEDGNQNYYMFQPISKYLKVAYVNDITHVLS